MSIALTVEAAKSISTPVDISSNPQNCFSCTVFLYGTLIAIRCFLGHYNFSSTFQLAYWLQRNDFKTKYRVMSFRDTCGVSIDATRSRSRLGTCTCDMFSFPPCMRSIFRRIYALKIKDSVMHIVRSKQGLQIGEATQIIYIKKAIKSLWLVVFNNMLTLTPHCIRCVCHSNKVLKTRLEFGTKWYFSNMWLLSGLSKTLD